MWLFYCIVVVVVVVSVNIGPNEIRRAKKNSKLVSSNTAVIVIKVVLCIILLPELRFIFRFIIHVVIFVLFVRLLHINQRQQQ